MLGQPPPPALGDVRHLDLDLSVIVQQREEVGVQTVELVLRLRLRLGRPFHAQQDGNLFEILSNGGERNRATRAKQQSSRKRKIVCLRYHLHIRLQWQGTKLA